MRHFFINELFLFISSNRPPSPNTQRKQQAPMNPVTNTMITREPPPPPFRPNFQPNTFGGNSSALPAPIVPQYVIIRYHFSFFKSIHYQLRI